MKEEEEEKEERTGTKMEENSKWSKESKKVGSSTCQAAAVFPVSTLLTYHQIREGPAGRAVSAYSSNSFCLFELNESALFEKTENKVRSKLRVNLFGGSYQQTDCEQKVDNFLKSQKVEPFRVLGANTLKLMLSKDANTRPRFSRNRRNRATDNPKKRGSGCGRRKKQPKAGK